MLTGMPAPKLPTGRGALVVLFRASESLGAPIAEGFGLPFVWRSEGDSAQSLAPEALIRKAAEIRELLSQHLKKDLSSWWLDLNIRSRGLSLRKMELGVESAAVPLAAGLWLAVNDGQPGTQVLSTGAIDSNGYIRSVEGYSEKIDAAHRLLPHPEKDRRIVYVPPADFPDAVAHTEATHLTLKTFDVNRPIWQSLQGLLVDMDQPPALDAPLPSRIAYANRPHLARVMSARSKFYKEQLVEELGAQVQMPTSLQHANIQRLLLPVSLYPDNAMLSLSILRPEAVMLVVSESSRTNVDDLTRFATKLGVQKVEEHVLPIEHRAVAEEDIAQLCAWLEQAPSASRVVDFTPGTREMLAAVLAAGINTHAALVYVRHSMLPNSNSIEYGTETLETFSFSAKQSGA